MGAVENTPDDPTADGYNSDHSNFESAYWRMLVELENHADDEWKKREVESYYNVWNERYGTQSKPRWK